MSVTGVFPVSSIQFRIGKNGSTSVASDMVIVKDMESFSISFDNGVEEWNPIDQNGWVRRLMTAKSVSVSISGKRHYGDVGNDYVASLAYENGQNAATKLEIQFPDGGDATSVAALEFECMSDGKPTYTKGGAA